MEIKFGKKPKMAFLDGIKAAFNLVSPTIGPFGSNYIIGVDPIVVTNNGYKIISQLKCENPVSQLGVNLLASVASEIENIFHDGTTTFIIIASKMIEEAQKYLNSGIDINLLSQAIKKVQLRIQENLFSNSTSLIPELTKEVAIAAAKDEEIGTVANDAFNQFGLVNYQIKTGDKLSYYFDQTLTLNLGPICVQMMNNAIDARVINNPKIIIVNGRYELSKLIDNNASLVVFNNLDDAEINSINRHFNNCPNDFVAINASNEEVALIRSLGDFKLNNGNYELLIKKISISLNQTILESSDSNFGTLTFVIPDSYNSGLIEEKLNAAIHGVINSTSGLSLGQGIAYLDLINSLKTKDIYEETLLNILSRAVAAPYTEILYNAEITRMNEILPYDFALNKFVANDEFAIYTPTNLIFAIMNKSLDLLNDYLYIRGFII